MRVAIIGSGASGIAAAYYLKQASITDFTLFEKSDDLGGTWRDNRYPGVACDVPSHLYRFTFAPNAEWTRRCSPGAEIQGYMRDVAKQIGTFPKIAFGHEVIEAKFADGGWDVTTSKGPQGRFDAVISASGALHHPKMPDIEGLDSFAGGSCHSARWDDSVDLTGKRVGIIGSGSTGTQLTCALAEIAGTLTLFQRTAQWIMPLPNHPIAEEKRKEYRDDPAKMDGYYHYLASRFNEVFGDAVSGHNPEAYDHMVEACEENLRASIADPDLRAKLTPDYKVGCKRLVLSDGFYAAIQRPNATLETGAISKIEPQGVRMEDGTLHELDYLIYATGFHAHSLCHPMHIAGRDGRVLADEWADGNYAYRSVAVPGFPNWFMIGGPNSPIGNFSYLMTAELQAKYVVSLIEHASSGVTVEPKAAVTEAYNAELREAMNGTIWVSGCDSWYFDKQGRVASYPWQFSRFAEEMQAPDFADFLIGS
ncbi:NAD(P)/FAD-dependent oxidoreductase [Pontixanthobacter aestiaquae]|uniref:NAD(P)-binding protein n=1 Tax=Pontixanthobacter aestiaquae TaxID=1509367 RepID=A0A844ZAK0_9SPHN|nr:NAD(P)/FAD-dependent oxidoreductase [Pontixanthobacter aestiaquae]MDN3646129.1 NAD(P)/FAD-dependent oxidoreductase [Pontixanthobacter aestiaquae]MXO82879.1 NAD(P)-binding protein [Pontixanthobacter aestiaquae]